MKPSGTSVTLYRGGEYPNEVSVVNTASARRSGPSRRGETSGSQSDHPGGTPLTGNFSTQLRAWLLIAGLSGLLLGIGAVIGGGALWLFVVLTVVFNVAMYWFSDKIALKVSRAQPVSEQEAPQLYADVQDLTQRAGLPMPRLYMIPNEQPNA